MAPCSNKEQHGCLTYNMCQIKSWCSGMKTEHAEGNRKQKQSQSSIISAADWGLNSVWHIIFTHILHNFAKLNLCLVSVRFLAPSKQVIRYDLMKRYANNIVEVLLVLSNSILIPKPLIKYYTVCCVIFSYVLERKIKILTVCIFWSSDPCWHTAVTKPNVVFGFWLFWLDIHKTGW